MDGQTFLDTLRDDHETALSRLGSSKSLYALTGGEMSAANVRAAAHDEAQTATTLFGQWADTDDSDAASLFQRVADDEQAHVDAIDAEEPASDTSQTMYETLDGFTDTHARLGALAGRTLVTKKTAEQMVGFFVGDASPSAANTFRGLRDDYDEHLDAVATALDDACESDDHWETAQTAADAVVDAAYDDYVETLESMGVKPKNVC